MKKVSAGRPTIEFLKVCYQARLPPLLVGSHGIGKSQLVRQAAAELGIECIDRDLSLMEPPDLIGLPKLSGKSTVYLAPEFLPRSGQGILLFEELNRCPSYMTAPCLQLLTTGTLNDYRLPPGWLAAAAVNPEEAEYDVRTLDPALLSRFAKVRVVANANEWLRWAKGANIHRAVLDYVAADPSALRGPEANPRAWKYVSDALQVMDAAEAVPRSVRAVVLGLVGNERGTAFLQTLKEQDLPFTAEAILASYPTHGAKLRAWVAAGKLDLVKLTLRAVKTHLQPQADYEAVRADRKRFANLACFLADLPGDLREDAATFFRERGRKVPKVSRVKSSPV